MTLPEKSDTSCTLGEVEGVEIGVGSIHMRGEDKQWYVTVGGPGEYGVNHITPAAARMIARMLLEAAEEVERR